MSKNAVIFFYAILLVVCYWIGSQLDIWFGEETATDVALFLGGFSIGGFTALFANEWMVKRNEKKSKTRGDVRWP